MHVHNWQSQNVYDYSLLYLMFTWHQCIFFYACLFIIMWNIMEYTTYKYCLFLNSLKQIKCPSTAINLSWKISLFFVCVSSHCLPVLQKPKANTDSIQVQSVIIVQMSFGCRTHQTNYGQQLVMNTPGWPDSVRPPTVPGPSLGVELHFKFFMSQTEDSCIFPRGVRTVH